MSGTARIEPPPPTRPKLKPTNMPDAAPSTDWASVKSMASTAIRERITMLLRAIERNDSCRHHHGVRHKIGLELSHDLVSLPAGLLRHHLGNSGRRHATNCESRPELREVAD